MLFVFLLFILFILSVLWWTLEDFGIITQKLRRKLEMKEILEKKQDIAQKVRGTPEIPEKQSIRRILWKVEVRKKGYFAKSGDIGKAGQRRNLAGIRVFGKNRTFGKKWETAHSA